MSSKAERRRNKRKLKAAMPELAAIDRPEQQHRVNGKFAKPQEDPRKTALQARKGFHCATPSQNEAKALLDPLRGCDVGLCLLAFCEDEEAKQLWRLWGDYTAAIEQYRQRILGQTGRPKGADLQAAPGEVKATKRTPDLRTEAEKDAASVSTYMRWQGFLGSITAPAAKLINQAREGDGPPLVIDREVTAIGLNTVYAIRELAKVAG